MYLRIGGLGVDGYFYPTGEYYVNDVYWAEALKEKGLRGWCGEVWSRSFTEMDLDAIHSLLDPLKDKWELDLPSFLRACDQAIALFKEPRLNN